MNMCACMYVCCIWMLSPKLCDDVRKFKFNLKNYEKLFI